MYAGRSHTSCTYLEQGEIQVLLLVFDMYVLLLK